jgi:MFS family permease
MTILLSLGGLVCTMSTSMIAPALKQISIDLDMAPSVAQLTLSIYLLAFVFGPLLIASCSEMYGRRPAYILAHLWYIIWNTLCPVTKSKGLMIAGRFLSGWGGSVSIAVSVPPVFCVALLFGVKVLTDQFVAREPFSGRHLEGREAWQVFKFGPAGSIAWSSSWTYSRWLRFSAHWVAMDFLDCVCIRRYAPHPVRHLRKGIVCAGSPCKESGISSEEHWERISDQVRNDTSNVGKENPG